METNKITQERYDEIYQKKLFERVYELIDLQRDELNEIEELGFDKLPNSGITLNNKIAELKWDFKHARISMYSHLYEDYGSEKSTFVGDSTIGNAILHDLIDLNKKSNDQITEFNNRMNSIINEKAERYTIPDDLNFGKRLLRKINIAYRLLRYDDFYFTEEEMDELMEPLEEYEKIDTELFKYNLKDNAVDSVVKELIRESYSKETAYGILDEEVIPEFKKLGLGNLVVPLKSKLENAYKLAEEEISEPIEEIEQQKESEQLTEHPTTEKENKIEIHNSPAKRKSKTDGSSIRLDTEAMENIDEVIQDIAKRHNEKTWIIGEGDDDDSRYGE